MNDVTIDADLRDWLLASTIPSIRYRTLVELLGRTADDPDVRLARQALLAEGPVPVLFAKQSARGDWEGEHSYYTPKYTSTHWSMLLLEELAVPGEDERFRRGADFMLSAVSASRRRREASGEYGLSCLYANILRYAVRAGFGDDPRLQAIVRYMEVDLGQRQCACAYNYDERCGWGVARSLWGAAAIPAGRRTPALQQAIERGVDFLLSEFALVEANYPTGAGKVHPYWFRLNFPMFYQSDILFALRAVAGAGALDHPGAQPALAWLAAKRGKNGRWRGSSPYRGRTWTELGGKEETDRWVSLPSAGLLAQAGMI